MTMKPPAMSTAETLPILRIERRKARAGQPKRLERAARRRARGGSPTTTIASDVEADRQRRAEVLHLEPIEIADPGRAVRHTRART